jgi:hypothetical protein
MKKLLLFVVPVVWLLSACEKEITVDLPKSEQKVVIEGFIEQNYPPIVFVSLSAGYFDPVDSSSIDKLSVRDAIVTISDGSRTETLKIYDNRYPAYTFISFTNPMVGEFEKTYTLKVVVNGKEYISTSKLHTPVKLDSVFYRPQVGNLGYIWGRLTEPKGLGNAYRWYAKRITKDPIFYPPFGSPFDDKFIDGTSFEFGYYRGMAPNSEKPEDIGDERGYFKVGDTVVVRFTTIDPAVYEFYRSYETEVSNNGNPFAAPGKVKTNIEGGALGIWGAFGAFYDTVIVK